MPGLRIALSGVTTFTGPNIPEIDPVIPDAGALLLIDASHPLGGFPSGAPTDNATITNLVGSKAATLLGGEAADFDVVQRVVNMTSTFGKVEKTTKGGIHAIQSLTQTTAYHGYQAQIPLPIITYAKANPSHEFYFSQWRMPTRVGTGTLDNYAGANEATNDSMLFGLGLYPAGGASGGTSVASSGQGRGTLNTPMLAMQSVTAPGTSFTSQPNTAVNYAIFELGNFGLSNRSAGAIGKHGAAVFWRGTIIDLTVAGRTPAEQLALDTAEFNKQVMTAGGRFYGDTVVTDPATLT